MAYTPNLADTQEILSKSGYKAYAPQSAGAIKSFTTGAGQGVLDTIISAGNAAIMGGNKINQLLGGHAPVPSTFQHPNIAEHLGIDTSAHPYLERAGEIAGGSALPGGAYVKGLKLLPEASGLLKVIPRAISGASAGALTGESNPGGRLRSALGGAALAGGGGALGDAFSGAKKQVQAIAQRALQTTETGSQKYKDILNPHGQLPIVAPKVNEELLNDLGPDERVSIGKMLANPTVMSAHEAQSDLNKYINDMTKMNAKSGTSVSRKNLQEALLLKGNIRQAIADGFKNGGQEGLGNAYEAASDFWAKNVRPYANNRILQKYIQGEKYGVNRISPGLVMKRLTGGSEAADELNTMVGHENPELANYKSSAHLKKTLGKIAFISAIASSIPGIEHLKEVM